MAQKGLRQVAHEDVGRIIQDSTGFEHICTLTNPAGSALDFSCRYNDIHLVVDPGTDQTIIGRHATAVFYRQDLIDAGFGGLVGVSDETQRPWTVTVTDINGNQVLAKVVHTYPDAYLGLIVAFLEAYEI